MTPKFVQNRGFCHQPLPLFAACEPETMAQR